MEQKLGWLAFPGLFKYLTFLGMVAYFAHFLRPDLSLLLAYDPAAIARGEWWRIFTHVIAFPARLPLEPLWAMGIIFSMIMAIMISNALEDVCGATRVTLFLIVNWLALTVTYARFHIASDLSAVPMWFAMFFAFATYFPKLELQVLLFFPVQVRFLALILFAVLLAELVRNPSFIVLLPGMLSYIIWVLPGLIRGSVARAEAVSRRAQYERDQLPADEAFHRCETCQRTDKTDPSLQFYTLPDGKEYCEDHVPQEPKR